MKKIFQILLLLVLASYASFPENDDKIEVGIDEQLGSNIPLDVHFTDADGNDIVLGDLFKDTKAVVLSFVYYRCPGICSPLLFEIADVANKSDLDIGYDYRIVTISMDDRETPKIAAEKRKGFLEGFDKKLPEHAWTFLTGDSINIRKVSNAAGFYFKREGDQFRHSGAFIFIDNDGKICRYLFPGYTNKSGFSILPFDFKMAVLEATKGKETPTIAQVLQFCFKYDPSGDRYVMDVTRVSGVIIVLFAVGFFLFIKFKPKKEFKKRR